MLSLAGSETVVWGQSWQTAWPGWSEYVPILQSMHGLAPGLYVPLEQISQASAPSKDEPEPGGHG